jgi:hypothetical protein
VLFLLLLTKNCLLTGIGELDEEYHRDYWNNNDCLFILEKRLKVPKREIFDRSDFPDFYTIKSLRVSDFGVKIKKLKKNI